jgi:hypothetical protein
MPSIIPPSLDYTDRDYSAVRLRLQGLARSVFPDWTDFNPANFGNLLLEMQAFIADVVSYYQDGQARECFWPTLTRRISAIRLGRLINFELTGAAVATGTVRFSIPAPIARVALLPAGTRMRSLDPEEPLAFRTLADAEILVGSTFVDVEAEQAEEVLGETFDSTNAPNQELFLTRTPYLDGSAQINAGDGLYTEIDTFLDVEPSDPKRFVVLVDQNERARVRFGNGVLGKIPEGTIVIDYKIGGGVRGNIEANKLGVITDAILDEDAQPVPGIAATNPNPFSGGVDRMSISQARSLGPASLRALTRTVTKDDFETHAREISGVARALMVTSNEDPAILENNGLLLIVAFGTKLPSGRYNPGTPSAAILDAVRNKVTVEKPMTITFALDVQSALFVTVNIRTRIYLSQGAVAATVKAAIVAALQDFFAAALEDSTPNPTIDFGANMKDAEGLPIAELVWSDVFNAVRDVDGVRKVDEGASGLLINNLRQSLIIGRRDFPRLGTVTVQNADTGLDIP